MSGHLDADFAIVARQWRELVGTSLTERRPNRLESRVERQDTVFFVLAERAFDDRPFVERLERLSQQWLRRCPCATTRAIAAYAAYLRGDFSRAAALLQACISDAPDDLDTWIDLAFTLNHLGDPLGRHILFNHDEYVRRYAEQADGRCTPQRLRALRDDIDAGGASYATVWPQWFEGVEPRL